MMGYTSIHCERLKQKEEVPQMQLALQRKRKADLVNDLVDPICVISNANDLLYDKLGRFLDAQTLEYFEMIRRAAAKSKMLVEELRSEGNPDR